jgi:hypothetical protein
VIVGQSLLPYIRCICSFGCSNSKWWWLNNLDESTQAFIEKHHKDSAKGSRDDKVGMIGANAVSAINKQMNIMMYPIKLVER